MTELSEAVRMQVGQSLATAGQTAVSACWLLEHDDGYSVSSLLTDIAAIEAALKRARQSVPAHAGSPAPEAERLSRTERQDP